MSLFNNNIFLPLYLCLLLMLSTHSQNGPCDTDDDCFGGRCDHGQRCPKGCCYCPPLWGGPNCETLNLYRADPATSGLRIANTTTWGGGIVQGESDGLWHMYAAKMIDGCGLKSWTSNSEIVHAVSAKPDGLYKVTGKPLLGTFSHNPTVAKVASNSYVLGHIGCGEGTKPPKTGCSNGTTCNKTWCWTPSLNNVIPTVTKGCDNPHWTGLMHSTSVDGPWKSITPENSSVVVDGGEGAWHSPLITNPSFWPFGNGSVLMAYSTGCSHCPISKGHKHIGLAFGKSYSGPFVDLTPSKPIFPWASEDPCIWFDTTNNLGSDTAWHILAHTDWSGVAEEGKWAHVSAHAVASSPFGPWLVTKNPPYTRTIEWDGFPTTQVQTRERPQIIFADGKPVALSNGVMPGNNTSPFNEAGYTGDWSYTHIQKLLIL